MARILVVDDDLPLAGMLAQALTLDGHEADTASTGLVALDRLTKRAYDAVVTDMRMPQLDGIELYREIARRYPHLSSRVLFMTGEWLSPDSERIIVSAGAPCLRKPFDLKEFREAVHQLFR